MAIADIQDYLALIPVAHRLLRAGAFACTGGLLLIVGPLEAAYSKSGFSEVRVSINKCDGILSVTKPRNRSASIREIGSRSGA